MVGKKTPRPRGIVTDRLPKKTEEGYHYHLDKNSGLDFRRGFLNQDLRITLLSQLF
jgi:hypothetical protein